MVRQEVQVRVSKPKQRESLPLDQRLHDTLHVSVVVLPISSNKHTAVHSEGKAEQRIVLQAVFKDIPHVSHHALPAQKRM